MDHDIARKLIQRNIRNVLPLMPSVGFIPAVRKNARNLVVPFAIYHHKDFSEQDEDEQVNSDNIEKMNASELQSPTLPELSKVTKSPSEKNQEQKNSLIEDSSLGKPVSETNTSFLQSAASTQNDISPNQKIEASIGNSKIVIDDGTLLSLKSLPGENSFVFIGGQKIMLGKKVARGGEGTIYEIPTMQDKVAKIYHKECATVFRKNKIQLMLRTKVNNPQLCWPEKKITNLEGDFVGYLMQRVPEEYRTLGSSVLLLGRPAMQKTLPGWDRLALTNLCLEITKVLRRIHNMGIIMGDINPMNIMIDPSKPGKTNVMIVDCDSMQIGGYPCPVGMKLYTSPGIYEREGCCHLLYCYGLH